MAQDPKPPGEQKKRFPGSFFLFLLVAVLIALTVQNFMTTKYGKVSFSYEVQHLANLQLIVPQDSRMVALGDNLVTFSGRFRDRPTDEGKKRYKFLQFLFKRNQLQEKNEDLTQSLAQDRKKIESAAAWFLQLSGQSVPAGGYQVLAASSGILDAGRPIVITTLPHRDVPNVTQLETEFGQVRSNPTDQGVAAIGTSLALLIQDFRSPVLGIGQESIKTTLRSAASAVEEANTTGESMMTKLGVYEKALAQVGGVVKELNTPVENGRLSQLRSVRDFRGSLKEQQATVVEVDRVETQLQKAREAVSSVIWFFNDKELSTRALEREDVERYDQWFGQARAEWEAFGQNKGLPFKAVDQPRNLVLDRTFRSQEPAPNYFSYLMPMLLVGLVVLLLYFLFARQMKGMGGGAMSFGKSPAKLFAKGMTNITFNDVAGCDEAKEELQEIIDFLKDPSKFTALGGKIPRGVLCVGPPGTGKTLIAKAVAGEANRPFFSISGSDFVEMFVGVGASRIRDLFEQAKKSAPCIIFIDEIDAVGRHRGAGIGGGHDEREQTLNQLLVEMDGFDRNEGVILMAATNRPDVLDKALLRPGRFDRRVMIDLPDVKGRFQILKVHAREIKLDPSVDLMTIARGTPGASGADLANLLNEAALLAARKDRTAVTEAEVVEARDKVRYGKERRSLELDDEEKKMTAYHESGHAVVGLIVEHADPVDKVTIIPRGFSLGATHFLPRKNRVSYWKAELLDHLAVAMGGRVAEELFIGDISSGAQQDITQATHLARSMVCEWGMSEELGLVAYDNRSEGGAYIGLPGYSEKNYSEATAQAIDDAVRGITQQAYKRAHEIIEAQRDKLDLMARMLIEFETLDSEDVLKIMDGKWDSEEKRQKEERAAQLHKRPDKGKTKEESDPDQKKNSGPLPEPA